MATKKLSDGVGKKIVEALKKQSEIEINPITSEQEEDTKVFDEITETFNDDFSEMENSFEEEMQDSVDDVQETDEQISEEESEEDFSFKKNQFEPSIELNETPVLNTAFNYQKKQETFMNDLDNFEIPGNIAVLKRLITQLPSGVSRHTGAQIIKQTMEALGISMKSVLQEAQQVQDGLNVSAKDCHNNIQEYKKQIMLLEKQAQNYHKQYAALNELISLFVQTGV